MTGLILITLRYTAFKFTEQRIVVAGLPEATPGTRLPLTHGTKTDFHVGTVFSYLDACPLNYRGFRWFSCFEQTCGSHGGIEPKKQRENRITLALSKLSLKASAREMSPIDVANNQIMRSCEIQTKGVILR